MWHRLSSWTASNEQRDVLNSLRQGKADGFVDQGYNPGNGFIGFFIFFNFFYFRSKVIKNGVDIFTRQAVKKGCRRIQRIEPRITVDDSSRDADSYSRRKVLW